MPAPFSKTTPKPWVVSLNMGYGHDRAAYGLEELAYKGVIAANDYPGIPRQEQLSWRQGRRLYETASRLTTLPLIGRWLFKGMDVMQRIQPFYPRQDLTKPTLQLQQTYFMIRWRGVGKHLVKQLAQDPRPLITTFFQPAFAAEEHGYPEDIYCVICDADISRAWAPLVPQKSRIRYFAPNERVVERLQLYGVPEKRIFLTGFPLPKSAIGGPQATILKHDLAARLLRLDPQGIFQEKYNNTLQQALGTHWKRGHDERPVTVTFCIGGAGAQKEIAFQLLTSLRKILRIEQIHFNIETGTRQSLAQTLKNTAIASGLKAYLGRSLFVHTYPERSQYFRGFTHTLRTTDILWTKPSELSFYVGLGLPIIIAPPIGSQEDFNKAWLESISAGLPQLDPRFAHEWLLDWIQSGQLAHRAWNGFTEALTGGVDQIEKIIKE